jgi:hypothetical protein
MPDPAPQPDAHPLPTFASLAMHSASNQSLDPDGKINKFLAGRGMGKVPAVVQIDEGQRCATLALTCFPAFVRVPFGWHVLEDQQRALVFDADGTTQVQLGLTLNGPGGPQAAIESTLEQVRQKHPGVEHVTADLGGAQCVAFANLTEDGQTVDAAYLYAPIPTTSKVLLQARVVGDAAHMPRAMDLVQLLFATMTFVEEDQHHHESAHGQTQVQLNVHGKPTRESDST